MTTQAEFFLAHAVDGTVPEAMMGQYLMLPEGDSASLFAQTGEPNAGSAPAPAPAPASTPAAPAATPAPTPEPVVFAKDGVHTIEYKVLAEARERARVAEEALEAQRLENAALKSAAASPAPTPAPTSAPAPAAIKPDFGDFTDAALEKGITEFTAAMVQAKVDAALAPLQQQQQTDAVTQHFTTIYTAHPTIDSMLESKELEDWIKAQPSYAQPAIRQAIDKGTAAQVVEVFNDFTKATGKAPPAPSPAPSGAAAPSGADLLKAAQDAIDKAAARPPASLSDIPGSSGQHDEAAALLDLTPQQQINRFMGKTPEQIEKLMAKAL